MRLVYGYVSVSAATLLSVSDAFVCSESVPFLRAHKILIPLSIHVLYPKP